MAPAAEQVHLPLEGPTLGSEHSQLSEHRDPADCRSCHFHPVPGRNCMWTKALPFLLCRFLSVSLTEREVTIPWESLASGKRNSRKLAPGWGLEVLGVMGVL